MKYRRSHKRPWAHWNYKEATYWGRKQHEQNGEGPVNKEKRSKETPAEVGEAERERPSPGEGRTFLRRCRHSQERCYMREGAPGILQIPYVTSREPGSFADMGAQHPSSTWASLRAPLDLGSKEPPCELWFHFVLDSKTKNQTRGARNGLCRIICGRLSTSAFLKMVWKCRVSAGIGF